MNNITKIAIALSVLIVGVLVLQTKNSNLGATLSQRGNSIEGSYRNHALFTATTTSGNSSRHATSSAYQIGGAEKVLLEFAVYGTTTITSADFFVYVTGDQRVPDTQSSSANDDYYTRFTDLVAVNGTSPTTADTYFARTGATGTTVTPAANGGATTTVAMDLSYGTWRSMICTASSSLHSPVSCNILVEY